MAKPVKTRASKKRSVDSKPVKTSKKQKIQKAPIEVVELGDDDDEAAEVEVKKGITEVDVGITEFINHKKSSTRIRGSLKQRYTDFLVNEIDPSGNVVHLTDLGFKPRELTEEEKEVIAEQERKLKERLESCSVEPQERERLVEVFGETIADDIISLMAVGNTKTVEFPKVIDDKEERTKIHHLIREIFEGRVESSTTSSNTFIFGHNANKSRRRKNNKINPRVEHNLGEAKKYIHFSLYKENKDTMEIAGYLAHLLKTQVKTIKYAGTKDRRGVTVQRMSIENFTVERMSALNKAMNFSKFGGFEYEDKPMKLGELSGNEFIITIKDVESVNPKVSVENALVPILNSLKKTGFINYYGMQRFGTFSISTHQIGKEVLLGNWKNAAELILSEQEIVIPGSKDARKIWAETKDAAAALKKMPRKCHAEYSILSRLDKSGKTDGEYSDSAYFNAIMGISRNLRIMYGHAYQSYVWNAVASKRIQLHGLKVVAGDLVLCENEKIADELTEELEKELVDAEDGDVIQDFKETVGLKARPITQKEIKAKKFDIYDVVLPSPGYDVIYPENEELKNVYVETMGKDGLDPFKMVRNVREFSLAGSYRHLVAKADNLEYHFRKYRDVNDQLVRTDLDILKLKEEQAASGKTAEIKQILDDVPEGEKTAVIVKMQLGVSTYATMALREIFEGDTSRFGGVVGLKKE